MFEIKSVPLNILSLPSSQRTSRSNSGDTPISISQVGLTGKCKRSDGELIVQLGLVILQLFPVFGAPNAQIGMLPLIAILAMTAIKDAIEDWRRAAQDNDVNNSATTKLGGWRNVNQPSDSRSLFEKIFHMGPDPGRPSRGVKKLRDAEASAGKQIVMAAQIDLMEEVDTLPHTYGSEHSHDYMRRAPSAASVLSKRSIGVVDWSAPAPGTASWERTLW